MTNILHGNKRSSELELGVEQTVSMMLREIGVPPHIKGYQFLREAIIEVVNTPNLMIGVTKSLYPIIAGRHSTSANSVERGISRAIEVAWERGDPVTLQRYFNYNISASGDKPTSKEFIAVIADIITVDM
ncbi:MAG: sporulation initiation factor Spo0A C-terminal domain-containing protein [Oscillospiraceae bacterium]|jgi:two-component system response regulator (stage 0 sporulation protein A)|nr:sporulation initiation factor Spo0A C-terminal domain-containing protein [Oscillospiraceae bacterium]